MVEKIADELRRAIVELGRKDAPISDTKEALIVRAWRAVHAVNPKVSCRMIQSIFYGEIEDPRYSLVNAIRGALSKLNSHAAAEADTWESLKNEHSNFLERHATFVAKVESFRAELAKSHALVNSIGSSLDRGRIALDRQGYVKSRRPNSSDDSVLSS